MHTKGNWEVESDGTTLSMGGQVVATAIAPDNAPLSEQKANASLCAASPDLLEACELCHDRLTAWIDGANIQLKQLDHSGDRAIGIRNELMNYCFLADNLERVIRKAKGEL
jgi:hypothetical protein